MAHWFHRNPLKASAPVSFDALKITATTSQASQVCGDLKLTRAKLMNLLTDPGNDVSTIETATSAYLSLLQGLCCDVGGQGGGESKLRKIVNFRWTNTVGGNAASSLPDAYFEMASMLTELALWYMKRSSKISSNEGISEDEAKEVYKGLRLAAGIFQQVKDTCASRLSAGSLEKHGDTDPRVLDAYHLQCLAEAQEVTVARSVELKHKPTITSAVSHETSKLFDRADASLKSIDATRVGKWRKYLQLKRDFYLAYAHSFLGESLLAEDKCGDAIRSLKEAERLYASAGNLCKEYAATKGHGKTARPGDHQFFRRLGPIINKRLDKAQHENGFIYHQKIPAEAPELASTPEYGIASPIEFSIPTANPIWTADLVAAFDVSKAKPQATGASSEDLKPVQEPEDNPKSSSKKSETGCTIS